VKSVSISIPLVRASVLQMTTPFLERAGAPVERLLEKVKLSPGALEQPELLVPFLAVVRFLEEAARADGIEDIGLRLGSSLPPLPAGTFGRLMGRSRTLHETLETVYRFLPSFNSGARAWLTRSANQVNLHHRFLHGSEHDWRQFGAAVLMQYLNLVRCVAGPDWRPTAVQVPMRELPGCRDVPLLADTPITFGQPTMTITLSAELLHRSLPRPPTAASQTEVAAWERGTPAVDAGGALRQVITTMLPNGYPDIHRVAEAVQMSVRTLQRRLHREGTAFAHVVAHARFDEARRLLGDPSRKVIDVALDLGYSDHAHFTRAFERWAGQPPQEFRRRLAADQSDAVGR
jgi:AraC-like DNA-binding protein